MLVPENSPSVPLPISHPILKDCSFLNQSTKAVDALIAAMSRGQVELQETPHNLTLFKRIYHFVFSPKKIDLLILKKIYRTWNVCIFALNQQEGFLLKQSVDNLKKQQSQFPREFYAIIPGLNRVALNKALLHIYAVGSLFQTFKSMKERDFVHAREYLDDSVRNFQAAGISKTDVSLNGFYALFLRNIEDNYVKKILV